MLSSQSTTITVNLLLLSILCIQTYIASGQQHHPRQLRKRQKDDGKRKFHLQQNGLIKDVMNDLHLNAKKIQSPSSSAKDIPPLEDTSEFATLSMTVYDYHIQGLTSCSDSIALPKNVTCQYYEHNEKEGTEVCASWILLHSSDYFSSRVRNVLMEKTNSVLHNDYILFFLKTAFSRPMSVLLSF